MGKCCLPKTIQLCIFDEAKAYSLVILILSCPYGTSFLVLLIVFQEGTSIKNLEGTLYICIGIPNRTVVFVTFYFKDNFELSIRI